MNVSAALDTLAEFTASTPLQALPADVRAHAPWVLLDVVGGALGGSASSEATALASACFQDAPAGRATVLRQGLPPAAPATAAWLNGISAVWLELDPGHRRCRTHAPAHVMPAALAEAQRLGAGGERLLLAFVLGCEAAYHMGAATTPRAEVNAHGTWGIVGAAAAVARLRGLDAAVTGRALRLAAQLPVATAFRSSLAGATVRHAYVGAAAQLATQAVALAQAGFTALDDAPAVSFGQVLGSAFDPAALVQGLGTDFEFMRDFAKLHACCHHLYPAVDALDEVMAAGPFDVREVDVILVHTYAVASRLSDPAPGNELAAKFSLPFGLAAHALRGSLGPDAFRGTALRDPAVLALAARVQVREDPQLTARFPLERPARVEVRFAGGASRGAERRSTRGDYLDPLTPAARTAKFDSLAAPVIGDTAAKQLRDRLLRIEQVPDTSCLLDPDSRPTA